MLVISDSAFDFVKVLAIACRLDGDSADQGYDKRLTMTTPLRILYLEDDRDFVALVKSLLEKEGLNTELVVVDNCPEFISHLEQARFDIILSDYLLPTCSGLQAFQAARQKAPETPFLLISGVIAEEVATESLRSGVRDYVPKAWFNRLIPALNRAVKEARELAQLRGAEEKLRKTESELAHACRMAGLAEMATSVLHNVGNVLNSLDVSVSLVSDELKKSKLAQISKVADLLSEHEADIGEFMASDTRGRQLPVYLRQLAACLQAEQAALLKEMKEIRKNVDHIEQIVAAQQNYSRIAGPSEKIRPADLVEEALRMNDGSLLRRGIEVIRQYESSIPEITVQPHKVIQILVNLIRNAQQACDESDRPGKCVTLRIYDGDNRVHITVIDNGVGIPSDNISKIFTHGFTTRKGGHGFGLHGSKLAAKELGGRLTVHSKGPGQGAAFTLELPLGPQPN
jgi:signal transduction histidine kinase